MAKKVRRDTDYGIYTGLEHLCKNDDDELSEVVCAKVNERERRMRLVTALKCEGFSLGRITAFLGWPAAAVKAYSKAEVGLIEIDPLPTAVRAMREGII